MLPRLHQFSPPFAAICGWSVAETTCFARKHVLPMTHLREASTLSP